MGGFIGTPSPELYSRWMQAATLSPFMRSHTVHDTPDQEPWSFGEETERRSREALERRYSLMPYLYSELHRTYRTGVPMYRPMWLEFPADEMCYDNQYQHQFMYGPSLLAAPVIREGQRFQKVYLPEGRWYEVETGSVHTGGRTVLVEAGLDSSPLLSAGFHRPHSCSRTVCGREAARRSGTHGRTRQSHPIHHGYGRRRFCFSQDGGAEVFLRW